MAFHEKIKLLYRRCNYTDMPIFQKTMESILTREKDIMQRTQYEVVQEVQIRLNDQDTSINAQ